MASSDSEYEEVESLVMVELHGVIDSEIFAQDSFNRFKILAIDSDQPILQLENFVFTGEYDQTVGTAVFFEEQEKRVKKCDPVFCKKPPRMLKYACKTNKKLTMKRVFVTESDGNAEDKAEGESSSSGTKQQDDKDKEIVHELDEENVEEEEEEEEEDEEEEEELDENDEIEDDDDRDMQIKRENAAGT